MQIDQSHFNIEDCANYYKEVNFIKKTLFQDHPEDFNQDFSDTKMLDDNVFRGQLTDIMTN